MTSYCLSASQLQASSSASVVSGLANESDIRSRIQTEEIDDDEDDEDEDEGAYERDLKAEKKGQSYSSSKSAEGDDEDENEDEGTEAEEDGEDEDEDVDEEIEEPAVVPKGQKGIVHKPTAVKGMSSKVRSSNITSNPIVFIHLMNASIIRRVTNIFIFMFSRES